MSISELLDKNNISYKTVYGSAYTTLFSVDEIKEEQHPICTANDLLVIGCGLNSDLLTINLSNSKVGYVFHDELWDETYEIFEDIYVKMPFEIEEFVEKAIENKNYLIDGTMAEELYKVI